MPLKLRITMTLILPTFLLSSLACFYNKLDFLSYEQIISTAVTCLFAFLYYKHGQCQTALIFISLSMSTVTKVFAFYYFFNNLQHKLSWNLKFSAYGVWLYVFASLNAVISKDPGTLERPQLTALYFSKLIGILRIPDASKVCATALVQKPLRSKHCRETDTLIARFDHFCPWTLNAIGKNNHGHFLGYLISTWIIQVTHGYAVYQDERSVVGNITLFLLFGTCFITTQLICGHFYAMGVDNQTQNELHKAKKTPTLKIQYQYRLCVYKLRAL